ncbi:hypothetical protein ACF07T_32900 [Streptomyces sp. NPDC015184]|uniref:hypothetical protein n=1 Tax=Streptomyces sp. NPDC015184 TaxID=3364946 RepID=UPI0037033DBF
MIPIPPAAVVVMLAGADDYRTTTPVAEQTPAGLVGRIGEYLLSSGYTIRPNLTEDP